MSENDEDYVYNILTNTSLSGTKLPSAIYMVGATKTNDRPDDLTTSACCHKYYSVIAHDDQSYADTDIVHPDQTSQSVPSKGENMVYNANPNRAAAVGDSL